MGLIREPLEVDFFFDPKPLTVNDQQLISDYIKADKAKGNSQKSSSKAANTKQRLPKRKAEVLK